MRSHRFNRQLHRLFNCFIACCIEGKQNCATTKCDYRDSCTLISSTYKSGFGAGVKSYEDCVSIPDSMLKETGWTKDDMQRIDVHVEKGKITITISPKEQGEGETLAEHEKNCEFCQGMAEIQQARNASHPTTPSKVNSDECGMVAGTDNGR